MSFLPGRGRSSDQRPGFHLVAGSAASHMYQGAIGNIAIKLCQQVRQMLVHTPPPIAGMIIGLEHHPVGQASEMFILGSHLLTSSLVQPALINHSGYALGDGVGEVTSVQRSPSAQSVNLAWHSGQTSISRRSHVVFVFFSLLIGSISRISGERIWQRTHFGETPVSHRQG